MVNFNYKEGDFVKCFYEGKDYKALVLENPENEIVKVRIMVSSKRTEPPIFEEVQVSIQTLKPII